MVGTTRIVSRRLQIAIGGALASGALLIGPAAGMASAAPGDCFGIPDCNILPGLLAPTGNGGGGYANGTAGGAYSRGEAGGGYATGSAGGAASRGQAGGAFNHAE